MRTYNKYAGSKTNIAEYLNDTGFDPEPELFVIFDSRRYSFSNCLAITSLCISLVPSPMVHSFTSR